MAASDLVLAMTGASGAPYGVRLLEVLLAAGRTVHLTMSPAGVQVLEQVTHNLEQMTTKIIHPKRAKTRPPGEPAPETTKIQLPPPPQSSAADAAKTMQMPVPPRDGMPQDGQAPGGVPEHPGPVEKPD